LSIQKSELRGRIDRVLTSFGWDPSLPRSSSTLSQRLEQWASLVCDWNQRIDLTAARSADELVDLLVADAAMIARELTVATGAWVDVGSGAGAPGLPMAVLVPELAVTLVEPKVKRVAFLRTVAGELERPDVRVLRNRADELAPLQFSDAVSRATLAPTDWLAAGARLATERVWVLVANDEPPTLTQWALELDRTYTWPLTGARRRLLRYARIS